MSKNLLNPGYLQVVLSLGPIRLKQQQSAMKLFFRCQTLHISRSYIHLFVSTALSKKLTILAGEPLSLIFQFIALCDKIHHLFPN